MTDVHVHIEMRIEQSGHILQTSEGCGCCSDTSVVSVNDAIRDTESQIAELQSFLSTLKSLEGKV